MAKIFRQFNNFHERIFCTDNERSKPVHLFSDSESDGVLVCSEIGDLSKAAHKAPYLDYPYIMRQKEPVGLYSSRLARSSDDLLSSVHSDRGKSGSPNLSGAHSCCSSSAGSRTRQLLSSIQMLSSRSRGVLRRVRPRQPEKLAASRSTSMSSSCSSASSSAASSASGSASCSRARAPHVRTGAAGLGGLIAAGFNPVARSDSFKFQPAGRGGTSEAIDHNIVPPRRLRKKCTRSPYLPELLEDYSSPVDLINHSKFRCVSNGKCGTQLVQVNEDYSEAVDSKTYVVPGDDVTTKIYCSSSPLANCEDSSAPLDSSAPSDLYSQPYDGRGQVSVRNSGHQTPPSASTCVVVDDNAVDNCCCCCRSQSNHPVGTELESKLHTRVTTRPPLYENVFESSQSGCRLAREGGRGHCGHGAAGGGAEEQSARVSQLSGTRRLSRSCDLLVSLTDSVMSRRLCYETAFDTVRAVSPNRLRCGHDPDLVSHLAAEPVVSSIRLVQAAGDRATRSVDPRCSGSAVARQCDGSTPCRVCFQCCRCESATSAASAGDQRRAAGLRRVASRVGSEETLRDTDSGYRSVQVDQSDRSSTVSSSASTGLAAACSDVYRHRCHKHSAAVDNSSSCPAGGTSALCMGGGVRKRRPHSVCVVAEVNADSGGLEVLNGSLSGRDRDRGPLCGKASKTACAKLSHGARSGGCSGATMLSPISDRSQETDYSPADWTFTSGTPFKLRLCQGAAGDLLGSSRLSSTGPAADHPGNTALCSSQSSRPKNLALPAASDGRFSGGDICARDSVAPAGGVTDRGGSGSVSSDNSALQVTRPGELQNGLSDQCSPELLFNMPKLRRRGVANQGDARAEQSLHLRIQRQSSLSSCEPPSQNRADERRTRLSLNIPNRCSTGDDNDAAASLSSQLFNTHVQDSFRSTRAAPTDKLQLIDTNVPLHRQRWYHGAISRLQAERVLRGQKEGSYLVRISESNRLDYSLSLKSPMGFMHMKIRRDQDSDRFILGQFSRPFESIVHLINHYSRAELPVRGAEHMSLLRPVADHQFL